MTPVKQTHFGGPDTNPVGNCMQAAVASLLDLELSDVPHFVQGSSGHAESWQRLEDWLATRELVIRESFVDEPGFALVKGPTHSGIHHYVIYRDGQLAHDPAGADGLLYAEWFYTIEPTSDLAEVIAAHTNGATVPNNEKAAT